MSEIQRKSLLESQKNKLGENLRSAWYFETLLDKSIIVLLGVLGLWKGLELLSKLFS